MADEDFEIDVYGDTEGGDAPQQQQDESHGQGAEDFHQDEQQGEQYQEDGDEGMHQNGHQNEGDQNGDEMDGQRDDGAASATSAPQQGTKRKEREDVVLEENATNALLLSELQWFTTEDEIRNLAGAVAVETELVEITFSEHKVNGKSKGYVFSFVTHACYSFCYCFILSGTADLHTDQPTVRSTSSLPRCRLQAI